jgi:hypothetical protein
MDRYSRLAEIAEERRWICLHVKAVASEISDYALCRAQTVFGDSAAVKPLMELAVAVVSRYLIRHGAPLRRGTTKTLVRTRFRRALQRHVSKLSLREIGGGCNDLEEAILAFVNSGRSFSACMNSERVVRLLSSKSRAILGLRDLGYTWKEIAYWLGVKESIARKIFYEELWMAIEIADHPESRQAELEVAKRARSDEMHNQIAQFREPIWE